MLNMGNKPFFYQCFLNLHLLKLRWEVYCLQSQCGPSPCKWGGVQIKNIFIALCEVPCGGIGIRTLVRLAFSLSHDTLLYQ